MFTLDTALPHTRTRTPSSQLEIAECRCQLFLQFCAASRVPYNLYCDSPHMCSSPAWQPSGGNSTKTLLHDGARKYALRKSTTTFSPRLPVVTSDSTTVSASSGGVDAYNSRLACVLYSFATHLARTLGVPGCPLSVSTHPVLMGAFPISRGHVSLGTLVCDEECTPPPRLQP